MSRTRGSRPIHLTDDRRRRTLELLTRFYKETFDEDLTPFRAEQILEFFLRLLGPPIYNQAIQDARAFLAEKLDDLDAEFYVPDEGER